MSTTQIDPLKALEKACKAAGNASALAAKLGISRQAVSAWKLRGGCPKNRAEAVEKLTGIAKLDLNPNAK